MSATVKATILVAEDNAAVAKVSAIKLERAGFSVSVAFNGQEALDKAEATLFNVIVTDEQMPCMTGQELCRRLRDDERYAETPIIFLTGRQFELDRAQLEDELGVFAVMSKPFSPRQLVQTVQTALATATPVPSA